MYPCPARPPTPTAHLAPGPRGCAAASASWGGGGGGAAGRRSWGRETASSSCPGQAFWGRWGGVGGRGVGERGAGNGTRRGRVCFRNSPCWNLGFVFGGCFLWDWDLNFGGWGWGWVRGSVRYARVEWDGNSGIGQGGCGDSNIAYMASSFPVHRNIADRWRQSVGVLQTKAKSGFG